MQITVTACHPNSMSTNLARIGTANSLTQRSCSRCERLSNPLCLPRLQMSIWWHSHSLPDLSGSPKPQTMRLVPRNSQVNKNWVVACPVFVGCFVILARQVQLLRQALEPVGRELLVVYVHGGAPYPRAPALGVEVYPVGQTFVPENRQIMYIA